VVFRAIEKILEEAGSSLAQVVRITVYLSSPADYAGMNEVYAKFLTDSPPARATVAATFLARSVRVEIDAIAIVSE
jgi:2-iminobutanoate/2-iminopropanoate deaminase